MKKLLTLVLALAMIFVLVACGEESTADINSDETVSDMGEENLESVPGTAGKPSDTNKPASSNKEQTASKSSATTSVSSKNPSTTVKPSASSKPSTTASSGSILGVWEPYKITVTSYGSVAEQLNYSQIVSEYGKNYFAFDSNGNHVEFNAGSDEEGIFNEYSYKNGILSIKSDGGTSSVKAPVSGDTFTLIMDEDGESEVIKVEFRRITTLKKSELIGNWTIQGEEISFGNDGFMRQVGGEGANKYTYSDGILVSIPVSETNPDKIDWTYLVIKDGNKVMLVHANRRAIEIKKVS